ncbi:uncharacterized protein L3040_009351 [Drepanopeziza brunnea f. sp. 'multigermtubi']|uniref:DNA-directed RNA polymerases I and III subunit RPAC1 n=1 Tax=Marssonina brunnea f. sp. multigermtubi (strain MB_m1) TaxID=1072389 RepID=K1Y256_MARBU|nr:RNA polymerase Rpb3/RpoA insert domain-containing protein [Drepanopeziza brunnea f. sp. 'multigermtubi' MB_m1]EKD19209.1 RNA polymerase Rpb3/RpoA insert domain-containing protein [Drepanopeziza brunnea f. sp. 'multigermtubi' MB_m1]KAJ5032758.1 hypothetical protein L3040_009351 [Drepanopeziza brunnea f. sp. 'multigermtubi']
MAASKGASQPSQAELERRRIVGINSETVTDITSTDFPGHYPGEDHSWDVKKFRKDFQVKFHHNDPTEASFSLIGLDASVANAFRRIMIAEIPTLAIENVYIYNNTSIIQDEVLAHRLGLIPLKGGNEGLLDYLKWLKKPEESSQESPVNYDYNTILLELNVECTKNHDAPKGEKDPLVLYHNAHIYAKDIKFKPFGNQHKYFSGEDAIETTNPDILIAKLRPGQCIELEMHAIKGVGSDHAKFSPVATASYRLLPTISILKPILGKDAEKFKSCFPEGVIGIDRVTKKEAEMVGSGYEGHEGEKKAVVFDTMKDTVSRECLRHEEFKDKVKLGRIRDHFIFQVESLGQWKSDELFMESIKVLRLKCENMKRSLNNMAST